MYTTLSGIPFQRGAPVLSNLADKVPGRVSMLQGGWRGDGRPKSDSAHNVCHWVKPDDRDSNGA